MILKITSAFSKLFTLHDKASYNYKLIIQCNDLFVRVTSIGTNNDCVKYVNQT
jgi:hypothetical protein